MENKQPFFSIVIPTKNRPDYLRDSIKSVLLQKFDDYELVVSDNYNDERTQKVIDEFKGRSNFKSYRTSEELNMIDHWEFATSKAVGKYVLLLADRKVLFKNALKKVHKVLLQNADINAFSFGVKVFDDQKMEMGWDVPLDKTQRLFSMDLLENFINENYYTDQSKDLLFPKTLNGCFKNEFAQRVREISGHYFNNKGVTTPDYSSLFINLTLNDEVMYIGEKIILTQGEQSSNGRHFGAGKYQAYMDALGLTDPYKNVPLKAPMIYNLLLVDLLCVREIFGGNLKSLEINWDNYFTTNYWDILQKERGGMTDDDLSFFTEAWKKAFDECREKVSAAVDTNSFREKFETVTPIGMMDKLVNFRRHLKDFVNHRYSDSFVANKVLKIKYQSCLEAAGFSKGV